MNKVEAETKNHAVMLPTGCRNAANWLQERSAVMDLVGYLKLCSFSNNLRVCDIIIYNTRTEVAQNYSKGMLKQSRCKALEVH